MKTFCRMMRESDWSRAPARSTNEIALRELQVRSCSSSVGAMLV